MLNEEKSAQSECELGGVVAIGSLVQSAIPTPVSMGVTPERSSWLKSVCHEVAVAKKRILNYSGSDKCV